MAQPGPNTPPSQPRSPDPALEEAFSLPAFTLATDAILFDMDGTLIDSTAAIVKNWEAIGRELGLDPHSILATSHGRRTIDVLRQIAPDRATEEYVRQIEGAIPLRYGADARELPGARGVMGALGRGRWTIVTSGTRGLVEGWFAVLGLLLPGGVVTADDVRCGKPDPEAYLLGRRSLGVGERGEVLVVEDAPAGVRAGRAAGCRVLALATTHETALLWEAGADWIVRDLSAVRVESGGGDGGLIRLQVRDALRR